MIERVRPTRIQQLILTGQRLQPRSPLYNMAFRFDLRGPLDIPRFETALKRVIAANECLRLRVNLAGELEYLDLSDWALPIVDGEPGPQLAARASQPLELADGCFDTTLYHVDNAHYVWYVNQHHVITDGVAFVEFFRQVERAYCGEPDATAMPFADFRRLEAESMSQPRFAKLAAFWKGRSEREDTQHGLVGANKTSRHSIVFNDEMKRELASAVQMPPLRSISRDLSIFSAFAAALLILRHRLFDTESHTLGMPMHSRNRGNPLGPVLEIGFIDVPVTDARTFSDVVKLVQADALRAMKNTSPGITCAATNNSFSWLLNVITASFGDFSGIACNTTWIHPGAGDAAHALRLQVHDFDATGHLTLHFDLATKLFTKQQREALPRVFQRLLRRCLANPNVDFRSVSLTDTEEAQRIDRERGVVGSIPQIRVLDLFQTRVAEQPQAIAVTEGAYHITYAELDFRASALARLIEPLDTVPILAPRGLNAVIAIIAALKAGRPFVPLEVRHPDERLNRILDALDNPPLFAQDADDRGLRCAYVIDLGSELPQQETRKLMDPTETAYIIFTSGTTGAPKGVEVGHTSFANYIAWAAETYGGGRSLDMPLFSSLAFDLTLTSIFVPLCTGGRVVVYGDQDEASRLAILDVMADDAVDVVKLTPSHLRLALHARNRPMGSAQRLRTLILGGEDLPRDLAIEAQEAFQNPLRIFNEYGPTEATVGCMIHEFQPGRDITASVPIGRPILNSVVELLDHCGQPVPYGFDGQLVLAGATLAIGYWRDRQITGRPYASGDRARRLPSGELVYLGRANNQLKFRGARIELQEIETALQALDVVDHAYVTITNRQSEKREVLCDQCGISSTVPGIRMDQGVCSVCQDFAAKRDLVQPYFKDLETLASELRGRLSDETGADCLVLASGGKDSSYALCKIVELGFKPVVLTLDNGYLSTHALANVERITNRLGLEWIRKCPDKMNAIFADSLARHSNVCNGCFKTIYTLAINYALSRNIPSIVTGLSRGQLFETRLLDMVDAEVFDEQVIDERVLSARIAYHRMDDAAADLLDVTACRQPETFSKVAFFDFYRYCDASLSGMLEFLTEFGGWQRPPDTGRSTNCLINDVGIYVHKKERHHHNYAVPYAWDVRMGHKNRSQAVHELNDELDLDRIAQILDEIHYAPVDTPDPTEQQLVAYYTSRAGKSGNPEYLRAGLAQVLPDYSIPTAFVALDEIPLTTAGKVNKAALPSPTRVGAAYQAPTNAAERDLARIWTDQFRVDRVSVHDSFFELGGDSIAAVQISVACARAGWHIEPTDCFSHPTIAEIGRIATRQAATGLSKLGAPEVGLPQAELEGLLERLSR